MIHKFAALFGGSSKTPTTEVAGTRAVTDDAFSRDLVAQLSTQQAELGRMTASGRYLSFIQTDKPIYRPGDKVYFRAWVLHAHSNEPIRTEEVSVLFANPTACARVQVLSPSDSVVYEQNSGLSPVFGTVGDVWQIPDGLAGGNYRLKLNFGPQNIAPAEREFNIREFSQQHLKMQLEFVRKGLGAGDEAVAKLTVQRADGSVPTNAAVEVTARVDGAEVYRQSGAKLSADKGLLEIRFKLPQTITRGDGSLNCSVDDGGVVESIGRTIPILLQAMDVRCYAEGGELVANLPSGLYVECFTNSGDPADLTAELLDDADKTVVARVQTVHEGRGRLQFTPRAGAHYSLHVREPTGILNSTPLPPVQDSGVVLSCAELVTQPNTPLVLLVGATQPGAYLVAAFKKDLQLSSCTVSIDNACELKEARLTLPSTSLADGVLRVTVFDEQGAPRAERLTFRQPAAAQNIRLALSADRARYAPGDTVKLRVALADAGTGRPVPALLGASVTDDTVLEMQERRRQQPRLPAMALLESDVAELFDSHVYLDPANPNAALATDLLLGTQGWRRFAFVDPLQYVQSVTASAIEPNSVNPTVATMASVRRGSSLQVDTANNTVKSTSNDYAIVQCNSPLRRVSNHQSPVSYYEVEVLALPAISNSEPGVVAIGFANKHLETQGQLPGWKRQTYAVHSDDGRFFDENRMLDQNWTFQQGDVVGLGFNALTHQAFFTKNGQFLGVPNAALDLSLPLYPTVGLRGKQVHVHVNLGATPFRCNVQSRVETKPRALEQVERLLATSAGGSAQLSGAVETVQLVPTAPPSDDYDLYEEERMVPSAQSTTTPASSSFFYNAPSAPLLLSSSLSAPSGGPVRRLSADGAADRKKAGRGGGAPPPPPALSRAPPSPAPPAPRSPAARGAEPARSNLAMPMQVQQQMQPQREERESSRRSEMMAGGAVAASKIAAAPVVSSEKEKDRSRMKSRDDDGEKLKKKKFAGPSSSSSSSLSVSSSRAPSRPPLAPRMPAPRHGGYHPVLPPTHVVTRQYAHPVRPRRAADEERSDFTETVFFSASQQFSSAPIEIVFTLSDSITSFRVHVDAVTQPGGALLHNTLLLPSSEPFHVDMRLPLEVTSTDQPLVPVALSNDTSNDLRDIKLKLRVPVGSPLVFVGAERRAKDQTLQLVKKSVAVKASQTTRLYLEATVSQAHAKVVVSLSARATHALFDSLSRDCRVVPAGFPFELCSASRIAPNATRAHVFSVPSIAPGSVSTSLVFYPAPLGNLTQALRALVQAPHGCFEQTSSTLYPMVMAQQYFLTHSGVDPDLIEKAKNHIRNGARQLLSFEVKNRGDAPSGGFDWYGRPPANESLTAYGLLEFEDMAQVFPLDPALLPRVRSWLVSRRDGRGKFLRGQGRYGFGHAPEGVTCAYILWALTERNGGPAAVQLDPELDYVLGLADREKKSDPYFVALVALALLNTRRSDRVQQAQQLATQLTQLQNPNGRVDGGRDARLHDARFTTITYSYGNGLFIESTALAALVWLRAGPQFAAAAEKAMEWLYATCRDGAFGASQSTILALKAIVEYDLKRTQTAPGTFVVRVDGRELAQVPFDRNSFGAVELPSFADALKTAGDHRVEVQMVGGSNPVPYSFAVRYAALQPDNDPDCRVELATQLGSAQVDEGGATEVQVCIRNKEGDVGQPMVVALIGLPGGLEPRHPQLRELVKANRIDFYEVLGRDVVVYLREMGPGQEVKFNIDCDARLPGTYTGPASRAYLYYTNEAKHWNAPLQCTIRPKKD